MSATVKISGEVALIVLSGDFDFSTQEELADAIETALDADGVKEIRVDLAGATFIDSSVIRALLRLRQAAISENMSLTLWHLNEQIEEIFAIGGFDQLFEVH